MHRLILDRRPWALPWPCVHEFIAIVTHPKIYDPPTALKTALATVRGWLDCDYCIPIGEEGDYYAILERIALSAKPQGPMIHDARIAAICMSHNVQALWTSDRDFSRFPSLKTSNPLNESEG